MADPQLTKTWWDNNKAKTLPPTALSSELGKYEKFLATYEHEVVKNPPSADVPGRFHDVKTSLGAVEKSVKDARGKCNKTLHRETIASLDKLGTTVVPKERKRLDGLYRMWEAKRLDTLKKTMDARAVAFKSLDISVNSLAKDLRVVQGGAATVDQFASKVSAAALAHDNAAAGKALADVVKISQKVLKSVDGLRRQGEAALASAWPSVPRKLLKDTEQDAVNKQNDKRSTLLAGVEKVIDMLGEVEHDVTKTVSEAQAAAKGGASADALVIGELTRLLARMRKAAEELNALTRDCTASVGNYWGALDEYEKAKDAQDKVKWKDAATKARLGTKKTLEGGKPIMAKIIADMDSTLRALPKGIIDSKSGPFQEVTAEIRKFNGYLLGYKADLEKTETNYEKYEKQYAALD